MQLTIKEIAELTNASIVGNENLIINNLAKIEEAIEGSLTYLYLPQFEKYFSTTKGSAIFVKPDFIRTRNDITYLIVNEPQKAYLQILTKYFSPVFKLEGIDKTAFIHPTAKIGNNVGIGKNVVISANCKIGDNAIIYHNTVLLENVEIGNDTLIFPNVSIRENCKIGNKVIIHSSTVIGSDGFGYSKNEKGEYLKIPQIGNVVIEDDVEIGSNVSIDRAALGSTLIKRGTKIDNLVQVGHNVVVGENTAISAQTGISGSTKIGNNCILAGQVGIVDHIEITDNVIIGAQSGIPKSIKKPGLYFGYPARELKESLRTEAHIRNLENYVNRIKQLEEKIKILEEKLNHTNE